MRRAQITSPYAAGALHVVRGSNIHAHSSHLSVVATEHAPAPGQPDHHGTLSHHRGQVNLANGCDANKDLKVNANTVGLGCCPTPHTAQLF